MADVTDAPEEKVPATRRGLGRVVGALILVGAAMAVAFTVWHE